MNNNASNNTKPGQKKVCIGTIKFNLFNNTAPFTTQTFQQLASGINGFGYAGTTLHQIIPNWVIQGGIVSMNDNKNYLYK